MSHPNSVHKRETESVTVVPGANGRNAGRAAELAADEAIVERIASGDTAGLGDLYDRHSRIVYSLACRFMSDGTEAEDVVQDVFSQAWRQASRYDSARAAVTGWLLMMTRARAIDRLRGRRSRPGAGRAAEPQIYKPADPSPGPEAAAVAAVEVKRLRGALDELNAQQRTAFELAYYGGLTQGEIADKLEEPLGTVKTRITSVLLKLRSAMSVQDQ